MPSLLSELERLLGSGGPRSLPVLEAWVRGSLRSQLSGLGDGASALAERIVEQADQPLDDPAAEPQRRQRLLSLLRQLHSRLADHGSASSTRAQTATVAELQWDTPLSELKGVGRVRQKRLEAAGVETVGDLLLRLPIRYEEPARAMTIHELTVNRRAAVSGQVVRVRRIGRQRLVVDVADKTGTVQAVWFNQPFRLQAFRRGQFIKLEGTVTAFRNQLQFVHPTFRFLDQPPDFCGRGGTGDNTPGLQPVYPSIAGLSPRQLAPLYQQALDAVDAARETLPAALRERHGLPGMADALRAVHMPTNERQVELALQRFRFEELFILELALLWAKSRRQRGPSGYAHRGASPLLERFRDDLPFRLTGAQERAWREIESDMKRDEPMHRLLQGDVGSGKTVVAVMAMLRSVSSGWQAALMAPTEILAEQHYDKVRDYLKPLGIEVGLLTGSTPESERRVLGELLSAGRLHVVVGTHALIEDAVQFDSLSLVITDEQHRFGVQQRAKLGAKGGNPDVLVMSATPIPRSLALTLFGDLDTSVIDELPPGRKPIRTYWRTPDRRGPVYEFVGSQLARGRQAFVVCPLVEESDKVDARSVTEWVAEVRRLLPGRAVEIMHGRMGSGEKDRIMQAFRRGELDALVSTTVIEVGIDVPNATMMVIEDADRFGLAQLHQLRGRIGRGQHASYCVLIADPSNDVARERLQLMVKYSDGFKLAEEDLRLRGPGEFLGTRQHGIPEFVFADPLRDYRLLVEARQAAQELLAIDPELSSENHRALNDTLTRRYRDFLRFVLSG